MANDNTTLQSARRMRKTAELDSALFTDLIAAKEKAKKSNYPPRRAGDATVKKKELNTLMESIADRVKDNRQMMDILTDLELAKRLVVASILSPKDLIRTELTYSVTHENEEVVARVTQALDDHFTNKVRLNRKLTEMLSDTLFDHGAHITALIPEESLVALNTDSLSKAKEGSRGGYHASMESMYSDMGQVTKSANYVKSDLFSVNDYTLTDDFRLLGASRLVDQRMKQTSRDKIRGAVSMEADKLFKVPDTYASPKDRGTALSFRLGIESTIPVHVPGDPSDHLGYIVMLDKNYRPINTAKDTHASSQSIKEKLKSAITDNDSPVANAWAGIKPNASRIKGKLDADMFIETYEAHIYAELDKALENVDGNNVRVSRPDYVMRLMLQRLLAREKTNMMYLPKELVTYIAFDYDDFGIGKSLLESTKIYGSIRVLLMFTELLNAIRASVPSTVLKIRLSDDDADKKATVDNAVQDFLNMNAQEINLSSFDPSDVARHISKLGLSVEVENAETFINTKVDVERKPTNIESMNTDLSERLRRAQYAGLGIQPEIIDNLMSGELATVFNARNALNSKSIMERQQAFEEMLSDHVRRETFLTSPLLKTIYTIVEEELGGKLDKENADASKIPTEDAPEKDESGDTDTENTIDVNSDTVAESETSETIAQVVYDLVESVYTSLPDPDLSAIRATQESFQEYGQLVDQLVEAYVTEDMEEMLRTYGIDRVDTARDMLGGALKRKWLREQNVLPEIYDFFDDSAKYSDFITDNLDGIAKAAKKIQKKRDKLSKSEPEPDVETADTGIASETGNDDGATDDFSFNF